MSGVPVLWMRSFFPILRQFLTATAVFFSPSFSWRPAARAALERNVMLVASGAQPKAPNIGRYRTGWGVGIEEPGSPIAFQAIKPPLMIISGFTPKNAGFQRTRSASLPDSMEPTSPDTPGVIAGLMVYFAT